jgi:hypothetical protein
VRRLFKDYHERAKLPLTNIINIYQLVDYSLPRFSGIFATCGRKAVEKGVGQMPKLCARPRRVGQNGRKAHSISPRKKI